MSAIGYNARDVFTVLLGGTIIAAIQSKTFSFAREPVTTTNDDSNGWRILLPNPAVRSVDSSIEGVATEDNYQIILAEWSGVVNSDITLRNADGSTMEAELGFFLASLEFSGEQDGHVAFSGSLQSSGEVIITPASTA